MSTPTIGSMSDVVRAESAPAFGAPDATGQVPVAHMTAEQAREAIEARKGDKDFYNRLQKQDPAAHAEWTGLHKRAFPTPQPSTVEDVNVQAAARHEHAMSDYIGGLKQQWAVTPEQESEIRGRVIRQESHDWAKEEKARLIADTAWRKRFFDGDRAAREQWGRVTAMLGLRPVKVA